ASSRCLSVPTQLICRKHIRSSNRSARPSAISAVGSGTVYKLINNLMGAIQIAGIAEGLAIAEQAGLDMKLVLEAVETGVAASLLADKPLMGRAAVEAYARAKAVAPDDDEAKMIEIVSRPKG